MECRSTPGILDRRPAVNEGDSSKKKKTSKLHVSGNYIWTRVWKNVPGRSWEISPSPLTYSLAEAESHRKSVEEDSGRIWNGTHLCARHDSSRSTIECVGSSRLIIRMTNLYRAWRSVALWKAPRAIRSVREILILMFPGPVSKLQPVKWSEWGLESNSCATPEDRKQSWKKSWRSRAH
jgi:hypothetical protein